MRTYLFLPLLFPLRSLPSFWYHIFLNLLHPVSCIDFLETERGWLDYQEVAFKGNLEVIGSGFVYFTPFFVSPHSH